MGAVFNPFQRNDLTDKSLGANLVDFKRINRRMHNKSFTVDNQVTILGGRNIAEEYFGLNKKARFHDDDVLAIGPVVQDVSKSFDIYWNHRTALPAPAFCRPLADPPKELDSIRDYFAATVRDAASTKYAEATRAKATDYLKIMVEGDMFRWAKYEFVVDAPDKGIPPKADGAASITTPLSKSIEKAEHKVIIVSPYFAPSEREIQDYAHLTKKGIEVIIITNSLAANNMLLVHGGYGPARVPLLKAGVKLYEARSDVHVPGSEHIEKRSDTITTLHTKEFIVDEKDLFIGSFNFDPRSINFNTECGVIIRDQELARDAAKAYEECLSTHAFEVLLNDSDQLRWQTLMDGKLKVFRNEPQTSWITRLLGLLARLAPNSQL